MGKRYEVIKLEGEYRELVVSRHPSLESNIIYGIKDKSKGEVMTQEMKLHFPIWFSTKEEAQEILKRLIEFSSGNSEVGLTKEDKKLMEEIEK